MQAVLKTTFTLALVSICLVGLSMITAERATAEQALGACPSASGTAGLGDIYIGQCIHPCGGVCDYWQDYFSGTIFYDSICDFQ